MNDKPCKIKVDGTEYYVACDDVENIVIAGSYMVNTSSGSINLYKTYPTYGDNSTGFPRWQASANQRFYYRPSNNGTIENRTVSNISVINRHISDDYLLSLVIIFCLIINLFKR